MTLDEYLERCFVTAVLELRLSKEEFLDLTPYEFTALVEHNAQMKKDEYQILRNTIYNAGANLLRQKGEKEIFLFEEEDEKDLSDIEKNKKEREALFGEQAE